MDWWKISYEDKLAAIKDILDDISYDDITFAWYRAILTVEPKPSEKYLDSCYTVISNLIKIWAEEQSKESQLLYDKLVKWESALHKQETQEKNTDNEQADTLLQWL